MLLMLPKMDGTKANEKPHGNNGLSREDSTSFTRWLAFSHWVQAGRSGEQGAGMLSWLLWLGVILTAHTAMGFAVQDAHLLPAACWVPPLQCSQTLSASSSAVLCLHEPHRQTSQIYLWVPARSKTSVSYHHSAEQLPFPSLGAALGAPEFSASESILNTLGLGNSYSQMGPYRTPETSAAAGSITSAPQYDHTHKYNMDVPGSSHMCVSWRPNLRGSMAWQRVPAVWP